MVVGGGVVVVLEILIVSFLRGVSQPEILAFNYIFYTLLCYYCFIALWTALSAPLIPNVYLFN